MEQRRSRIPRNVIILSFVAFASGFGQDIISPVLPGYLLLLGMSNAQIGLIDGLLQGATNVFRFVSGWISDRTRKRKEFVFLGYALSSVARPLLAVIPTFGGIAALRVADGIGKGTKDAPRDALVADESEAGESGRAFGFARMVDTAGSVFGPLAAFAILALLMPTVATYRLIFATAVIPGAVALGLIWFGVRERTVTRKATAQAKGKLPMRFWIFTIGMSAALLTKINDSLFLVRTEDLGLAKEWIPLLFGGFTLLYAALSYPIGVWSDRVGKLPLIAAGWLVLAIVEFGFSFDPGLPAVLSLFACYGLFYALTEGSGRAFIADMISKENHGLAYSVYYTTTGVSLIAGGYLLGLVWDRDTPDLAFRIAAAGSVLGALVLFSLLRKRSGASARSRHAAA